MSTILVVDDDADITLSVRIALEIAGHEVVEAHDGAQALQRTRSMPDAILLDLRLPDMDGFDVLSELKGDPATARIPVMCVSGHVDSKTKQQAFERGADAYITKPYELGELRDGVTRLLTRYCETETA